MKKLILLSTLLLSFNSFAAEPITLVGMNMNMSVEERTNLAKSKGYSCFNDARENQIVCTKMERFFKDMETGRNFATLLMDDRIVISEQRTEIGCAVYSNCKASVREVAQFLVNNRYIDKLEHRSRRVGQVVGEWYEGIGRANDKLIVMGHCLIIDKHRLGSSFNLD